MNQACWLEYIWYKHFWKAWKNFYISSGIETKRLKNTPNAAVKLRGSEALWHMLCFGGIAECTIKDLVLCLNHKIKHNALSCTGGFPLHPQRRHRTWLALLVPAPPGRDNHLLQNLGDWLNINHQFSQLQKEVFKIKQVTTRGQQAQPNLHQQRKHGIRQTSKKVL